MIKLRNVYNVNVNEFDEVWVICRSIDRLNGTLKRASRHEPDLSPTVDLFYDYLNWSKKGLWNKQMFDETYVPRFIEDLNKNENALQLLDELCEKSHNKNIALCCFCKDETMCHRSIIRDILKDKGANI